MPTAKDSRFIIFKKNNLYGLFDTSGKVIVPANYDEIAAGYQNTYHLRKGDKWGFTGTQKGDQLIEPQFDIILLRNGLITGYRNKKQFLSCQTEPSQIRKYLINKKAKDTLTQKIFLMRDLMIDIFLKKRVNMVWMILKIMKLYRPNTPTLRAKTIYSL